MISGGAVLVAVAPRHEYSHCELPRDSVQSIEFGIPGTSHGNMNVDLKVPDDLDPGRRRRCPRRW